MQFFQLPKITQDQMISLWILGYAREAIESMFHVSHGTIQNIVTQYTKSDPLIPLLRQIATTIKNSGLRIEEYAFNLRIIQAIARMNCPTEWIESFLIRVENEYISTNRPIEELVATLSEISEFVASRNISLKQAFQSLKELMQEITRIESGIDKAEEMRHQSDQALKQTLSINKISMEKVDDFVALKAQLKENGFTTNDIRKCCNLLLKLKKSGFDVKKIAPLLEAVDDLQDRKDRLEKQCLQVSCTIRDQMEFKERSIGFWGAKLNDAISNYVWLSQEHNVTKEEFISVVFALRNNYPYISPSELVELISKYGNMRSGITGMLATYPFS